MHPTVHFCYNTNRWTLSPRLENNLSQVAMRKKTILLPVLLVLLSFCRLSEAVAAGAPPPSDPPPSVTRPGAPRPGRQPVIDVSRLEKRIHALINRERKKAGVPTLGWNQTLQQIARNHSRNMATRRFFSHTDPEGRNFSERYRRGGFKCAIKTSRYTTQLGGENIAYNNLSSAITRRNGRTTTSWNTEEQIAAAVVGQWMSSSGHRRNILTRHYRREGIGVAIGKDGKVLVTQNFC
jgi:uncharacterized protein YkwD